MSTSERVVERIIRLRRVRNMTRDDLAAACSEIGHPELTAPALANIETGRPGETGKRRRDVTVDELTAFAEVFSISPAELLSLKVCSFCDGQPPPGMSCNACGAGAMMANFQDLRQGPQRRRRLTRELLEQVAETYRQAYAAGDPPTQAVSAKFTVSHSTAGRWVVEARRRGALGPANGTSAGEAVGGPEQ